MIQGEVLQEEELACPTRLLQAAFSVIFRDFMTRDSKKIYISCAINDNCIIVQGCVKGAGIRPS